MRLVTYDKGKDTTSARFHSLYGLDSIWGVRPNVLGLCLFVRRIYLVLLFLTLRLGLESVGELLLRWGLRDWRTKTCYQIQVPRRILQSEATPWGKQRIVQDRIG